jgi:hypothetical protein
MYPLHTGVARVAGMRYHKAAIQRHCPKGTPSMPDVVTIFISHHHSPEEDAFTARLKADLRAKGADVRVELRSTTSSRRSTRGFPGASGSFW